MHSSQCMPIRAAVETIILPPQKVPLTFAGTGNTVRTGLSIPENHALTVVSDGNLLLTLINDGDTPIVVPLPAGYRRIIPIRQIGFVDALAAAATNVAPAVKYTLWIEDLRAMEPWLCDGALRP